MQIKKTIIILFVSYCTFLVPAVNARVGGIWRCSTETHHVPVKKTRTVQRSFNIKAPHRKEGNGGEGGKSGKITLNMFNRDINKSFFVKISHNGLKGKNGVPPSCSR